MSIPYSHVVCDVCLERGVLTDLGPKMSEAAENEYDYPYWCGVCDRYVES